MSLTTISEPEPVLLQRFPYPFQAGFAVASDIDSANLPRFRAVHRLFGGSELIPEDGPDWRALGLTSDCRRFCREDGGLRGLGLDLGDSFFLVGDATTFGMYRCRPQTGEFVEDEENGENCAAWIRRWLKQRQVDSYHAFLHYTRLQIEPLLQQLFTWCEREQVSRPRVWLNHSAAATPSGLCPDELQPNSLYRLARLSARFLVGPLLGRKRQPLRQAFVRYQGDTPGSPYYINDLLANNGLRFVWLNVGDLHDRQLALPEEPRNGRPTILRPVKMNDGSRYWRFERCRPAPPVRGRGEAYLRDSADGYDASRLITERNLEELCRVQGTCILYTHWTHFRSVPIAAETIGRFDLLRQWRDAGKVWVASTSRLLDWTRLRTFLKVVCRREGKRLLVDLEELNDPIFGREPLARKDLGGLCFRLSNPEDSLVVAVGGKSLDPELLGRAGDTCWIRGGPGEAEPEFGSVAAAEGAIGP